MGGQASSFTTRFSLSRVEVDAARRPLQLEATYTAFLTGTTGATGRRILEALVESSNCEKVVALSRRELTEDWWTDTFSRSSAPEDAIRGGVRASITRCPDKVQVVVVNDFEPETLRANLDLESAIADVGATLAGRSDSNVDSPRSIMFSALGTSPFSEKVDYHYSVSWADFAAKNIPNLALVGLVSSKGADSSSLFGYMQTMGRREEKFAEFFCGSTNLLLARPGPIGREELADARLKERILRSFSSVVPHVPARAIGRAMVQAAEQDLAAPRGDVKPGIWVLDERALLDFADQCSPW